MENQNPIIERRQHDGVYGYRPQMNGRSYGYVCCPFCRTENKVYVWSLSGGGKRCINCKSIIFTTEVWLDQKAKYFQEKKNIKIESL